MISSLLHLVGLRPRVYYTLTNFNGGGGKAPLAPPPQYANVISLPIAHCYIDRHFAPEAEHSQLIHIDLCNVHCTSHCTANHNAQYKSAQHTAMRSKAYSILQCIAHYTLPAHYTALHILHCTAPTSIIAIFCHFRCNNSSLILS